MKEFIFKDIQFFDPIKTFDCGQAFNFEILDNKVKCIFRDMTLTIYKEKEDLIIESSKDISNEYFKTVIIPYLSLDDNMQLINDDIIEHFGKYNDVIKNALKVSSGIRILKQDYFETLISFIISQNNNIPRIKKIIKTLSYKFGNKIEESYFECYSFPTCDALLEAGVDEIRKCGTGFRDKYIISACEFIKNQNLDFDKLSKEDYETQLSTLMQIKGVGEKVANCFILYSLHNLSAFPVDVWIKRVIDKYYGGNLDLNNLGKYAGVAQQYLFYYERYN